MVDGVGFCTGPTKGVFAGPPNVNGALVGVAVGVAVGVLVGVVVGVPCKSDVKPPKLVCHAPVSYAPIPFPYPKLWYAGL